MKKKLLLIILSITIIVALMPSAYALPTPDWGALLKEKEAMVNETDFDLYVEGSIENAPYYGAKFEPRGGAYIGMLASASESYKPLGSYLTYVESYWQDDLYVPDNRMVKNDNVITMVGWTVKNMNTVNYDGVRHVLEKLNSYGKPMLVRFANEMNVSSLGDNPEQYVNVFRNVANMIHEYPNLGVVWSPNDLGALDKPFELYYPGDEYIAWIGVSCYSIRYFLGNPNTTYNNSVYFMTGDYSFATNRLKPIMKFMQEHNINKPVMISEGGVATNAGTEWNTPRMRNMMYSLIMKYPQIKMINYFNVRMKNESEWFDITSHQSPSDIFKEAASSGAYIRNYGDSPRFVFSRADIGDTLVADADGIVNLYTLAHVPKNPDVYVTYNVDGAWYHEAHEIPYKCGLNVNNLADGEHTITIEGVGKSKTYRFIKRDDRIRFGGEPDMSKTSNLPKDKSKGNDIRVFVKKSDGNTPEIKFYDQYPVIVDGSTLVPLRDIFEGMDTPVEWDADTQTVKWDTCTMKIGSSSIEKLVEISYGKYNRHRTTVKETVELAVPAQIMNRRTMVPLRAIAECPGYTVDWDGNARTVTINM